MEQTVGFLWEPEHKILFTRGDGQLIIQGPESQFLRRSLRFGGQDLRRAMALHRHAELVRQFLPAALPAPRVSIALSDGPQAAQAILSRRAGFLTCLGEGEQLGGTVSLSYDRFSQALDQADAGAGPHPLYAQQVTLLGPEALVDALIAGPGHLCREAVQVIELCPLTYLVPVKTVFHTAMRKICMLQKAVATVAEKRRRSRHGQDELEQRLLRRLRACDATARMCLYLLAAMLDADLRGLLVGLVAAGGSLVSEGCLALARYPESGALFLDMLSDPGAGVRSQTAAMLALQAHCLYQPRSLPEIRDRLSARRPQLLRDVRDEYLPLSPAFTEATADDAEEVVRVLMEQRASISLPWADEEPLLSPRALLELSALPARLSAYFPDRVAAERIRQAWQQEGQKRIIRQGTGKGQPVVRGEPRVGRNAPCPCGSGRKHKVCCGAHSMPSNPQRA